MIFNYSMPRPINATFFHEIHDPEKRHVYIKKYNIF